MPAVITFVTPQAYQGGSIHIQSAGGATGFGASQGTSKVLFFDSTGEVLLLTPTSWTDTRVDFPVPVNASSGNGYVVVQLQGESLGARSGTVSVLLAIPTPPTHYTNGTFVLLQPGTIGSV